VPMARCIDDSLMVGMAGWRGSGGKYAPLY
jgi:hypothetical protein